MPTRTRAISRRRSPALAYIAEGVLRVGVGGVEADRLPVGGPASGYRRWLYRTLPRSWCATARVGSSQIGSKRLIMPNTCPGQPSVLRLACSVRGSPVP